MKRNVLQALAVLILICATGTGCRRSDAPDDAPPPTENQVTPPEPENPPPESPLAPLFASVDELLHAGDTNAATARLTQAVDDPAYEAERPQLCISLIRFLLYTGQVTAAQDRVIQMLKADPELGQGAIGYIYGHLQRGDDPAATLAWVQQLLTVEGLPEIRLKATEWQLLTYQRMGDTEALAATIDALLADSAPAESADILDRLSRTAMAGRDQATVDLLLARLKATAAPEHALLAQTMELELAIARGQWDAVARLFPAAAATLDDPRLNRVWRALAPAARQAHQTELLAQLAELLVREHADKRATMRAAAPEWLAHAKETGDAVAIPLRLEQLRARQFPSRDLFKLFQTYFYATIADPGALQQMMDLAEALMPELDNETSLNTLKTMTLDGSFVAEDYDRALRMLEAGIPDRTENWHAMASSKVKAHRAQKQNAPLEAVKFYREFMKHVAESEEADNADPSTGVIHTKEMILGRNAKRIGDILKTAGDEKGALSAYAQALGLYRKALEKVESGTPTEALIKRELKEVPTRPSISTPPRSL